MCVSHSIGGTKKNTVSLWVFSDIQDFDIDELGDFDNEDDDTNVSDKW